MLSAYFRDIAHKKTMLELLHDRDEIQQEAREELRRKFREFDIECVDVLIGKPDTAEAGGKIETLLEQLRLRQLSIEQMETYERQRAAAEKLRMLNEAQAQAADADAVDQRPRAGPDRREPRRGGPGPRPQAGGADRRHGRGRAGPLAPRRRSRPWCWPKPAARSSSSPAAAKASGSCRWACRRPRCCCGRSAPTATRGCTPCRSLPRTCRTARQPLVPERVFVAGGQWQRHRQARLRQQRHAGTAVQPAWWPKSPASRPLIRLSRPGCAS